MSDLDRPWPDAAEARRTVRTMRRAFLRHHGVRIFGDFHVYVGTGDGARVCGIRDRAEHRASAGRQRAK